MPARLLCCCLVLLVGCGAPLRMTRPDPALGPYATLNQRLEGQRTTLHLHGGDRRASRDVSLTADSVYFRGEETRSWHALSLYQVERITVQEEGNGALLGVLVGATPGVVMAVGGSRDEGPLGGEIARGIGLLLALVGAAAAGLIGGLVDSGEEKLVYPAPSSVDAVEAEETDRAAGG